MPIGTKLPPGIPTITLGQPTGTVPTRDLRYPSLIDPTTGRTRGMQFQSTFQYAGGLISTASTFDLWVPNPLTRIRLKKLFVFASAATVSVVAGMQIQLFENDSPTGLMVVVTLPTTAANSVQVGHEELDLGEGYVTREPGSKLRINLNAATSAGGFVVVGGGNEEVDLAPTSL